MSNRSSFLNWGGLLILLFLAGSAPLWSVVADRLSGDSVHIEAEPQIIEIALPMAINGVDSISLTGLQLVGVLAAVVLALVLGAGVAITFAYTLLSKQVSAVTESDDFQARQSALQQLDKEKTVELRNGRKGGPIPSHKMPRWSVLSTSLIILFFVVSFAMLVNSTFVPSGEYINADGELAGSVLPIVGGTALVALAVLLWRMRPKALDQFEATDYDAIPWDAIWVILSGMLVVGLGIGYMAYLNVPG